MGAGVSDQIGVNHLIARHAAGLVWLARYMERIENLARLLDVTRTFARDSDDSGSWLSILRINSDETAFFERHSETNADTITRFYLLERGNPSAVQTAIHMARENARMLRALISTEMWLQINIFHGRIRALTEADLVPDHLTAVCTMLKEGTQAHTGITEGTFYRDQCWNFYMIGRYLERADQTTRLLDIKFNALLPSAATSDANVDAGQWNTLLRAAAGYHAYRREHPNGFTPPEVAGFLLLNGLFPRSVRLNLAQLEWHLTQLHGQYHLRGAAMALERLDMLRGLLVTQSIEQILSRGLSPFLDYVQSQIGALHGDIMSGLCGE